MLDRKKSVFDDLDALRQDAVQSKPRPAGRGNRRAPSAEPFARIPYDRGLRLYGKISATAWVVLIELDRLILLSKGQNPVPFEHERLYAAGMQRNTICQALQQLETAKVVQVKWGNGGNTTLVTHLWYPTS
jgi:hypothetical protein